MTDLALTTAFALGELIVMACNVAAVTVSAKLFEVIPFWVAMMLLEPIAVPLAKPAVLTFTVTGLEEVHVVEVARFWVLPSLKVPVAVN